MINQKDNIMKKILDKIEPVDIIAIITIVGGLYLKFSGADGTVGAILTAIVAFYFGKTTIIDKVIVPNLPPKPPETVEGIIRQICKKNGVDEELAIKVATCESSLRPDAVNINKTGTKDRGIFQWNDYYHPEVTDEMAFDPATATELFCQAVKNGNIGWWSASRKCWEKK